MTQLASAGPSCHPGAVDEHTLAYVAGVVDLLGLIRIRTLANGTKQPVVQMHGKYMPTLNYMGELTGTKAIEVSREYTRAGCAEHCKEKHMHVVSVSGRWSLTGVKATIMLWNIRPYLRLQADKAIEAIQIGTRSPFKQHVADKMRDLGWDVPDLAEKPVFVPDPCAVDDCDRPVQGHGYCTIHYPRWRRYGDPLAGGPTRNRS